MPTLGAIFRGIAAITGVVVLVRRLRRPSVPPESRSLLDGVQPPTREEIELYVPEAYRNPGPDWVFTRAKVLTFSEARKTRTVGSVAGFDVAEEFEEEYSVYSGVYGYYDHRRELQTFRMAPTENDRAVRPGRSLIVCFDRKRPRVHRLFAPVRRSQPAK